MNSAQQHKTLSKAFSIGLLLILLLPLTVQFAHAMLPHEHNVVDSSQDHIHNSDQCCDLCKVLLNTTFFGPETVSYTVLIVNDFGLELNYHTSSNGLNTPLFSSLRAPPVFV